MLSVQVDGLLAINNYEIKIISTEGTQSCDNVIMITDESEGGR